MFRNFKIIPLLLALGLVLSFASCASDTASDMPDVQSGTAYLQVKVSVDGGSGTRAGGETTEGDGDSGDDKYNFTPNPNGGEDGDGDDKGEVNERTVTNLNLLLYASEKDDMSDGNATIDKVIYFENFSDISGGKATIWSSGLREIPRDLTLKNYHVLVVANAGDKSKEWTNKKLSQVRDALCTNICTRNASDVSKFSNFLMSSVKNAQLTSSEHSGSADDPYLVDVDIERLAARIDILPNVAYQYDKTTKTYTYNYNVTDASGNLLGGFVLQYVMPYNDVTSGEYLIKRVTNGTETSTVNYNSKETADANYNSTNYVVCPWSNDRTNVKYSHSKQTVEQWQSENFDNFYKARKSDKTHGADNKNTKATTPYTAKYFILDYVQENTTFDNSTDHSTGLVFKGLYYDKEYWVVETDEDEKAKGNLGHPTPKATGTPKCYTYVIRHSDPNGTGTTSDPMHYGIVRNNIYRVRIDGIQGKGPDGMKLNIQVRKWATYSHEETTM